MNDYRPDSIRRGIQNRWKGRKAQGRKSKRKSNGKAEERARQASLDASELERVWR